LVPHVCDLEDAAAVEAMCAEVLSRFGRVDVLVNNAGIVVRHPVDAHPVDAWDRVQAVNLRAPFQLARACLPAMRAARAGRIINVSSISGTLGTPGLSAYCASKWGLIGFTKALAEEVTREGVVVTAVCPGSVDTEMLKGSGYAPDMTPDDVAAVVEFLVHAPAAVAGCALEIFG
jgi:3-oxoacyl-[acyl-carrier protein] reductase